MLRFALVRILPAALLALPAALALAGVESIAYTGKSANDSAIAFDLDTGLPIGGDVSLLPEGNYPYDASITPDGAEVWIVGAVGDGVVVLDRATGAITHRVDLTGVGEYPVDVLFDACGRRAYVSSRDTHAVAIIDRDTYQFVEAVPLPGGIWGGKMAISRARDTLYVVEWYGNELATIDLTTHATASVGLGNNFWDAAIAPDDQTLYVTDRGTDQIRVVDLDTLTVADNVAVGDDPWGIDITPDGSWVVVASEDSSSVTVFDTATLTPTTVSLTAGSLSRDVEIAANGAKAYLPSGDIAGDDAVYEIDPATGALLGTIFVGPGNTNVVAVRPQPSDCALFADGFETGDTSRWSSVVP